MEIGFMAFRSLHVEDAEKVPIEMEDFSIPKHITRTGYDKPEKMIKIQIGSETVYVRLSEMKLAISTLEQH